MKTAQAAGFTRIVDVTDAYDGLDPAGLAVDADDFHPNALAHERLAQTARRCHRSSCPSCGRSGTPAGLRPLVMILMPPEASRAPPGSRA